MCLDSLDQMYKNNGSAGNLIRGRMNTVLVLLVLFANVGFAQKAKTLDAAGKKACLDAHNDCKSFICFIVLRLI